MKKSSTMSVHVYVFVVWLFFILLETKKSILIEEKIQEKEEIQEKEKKPREGWEVLPTKQKLNKRENTQLKKTKNTEKPQHSQTFEAQTAVQLSCKTLRGTPLKAAVQEAQREEKNRIKSHNISFVLPLSSKILSFLSCDTIHIKVRQAICQSVLPLNEFPKPLKAITNMSSKLHCIFSIFEAIDARILKRERK